MKDLSPECFISVDVEASGPVPGVYSLLSIGASHVYDEAANFECILKPVFPKYDPKAVEVTGFDLNVLMRDGLPPATAMAKFAEWVEDSSKGRTPVFVGMNAAFDWSFVNYYFHVFHKSNPFGFAPLDIKALFMGVTGSRWADSKSSSMSKLLLPNRKANHNALEDALAQAELFRLTLEHRVRLCRTLPP